MTRDDSAPDTAAPLTAEQIAELEASLWHSKPPSHALSNTLIDAADRAIHKLYEYERENAALRDRLARAEATNLRTSEALYELRMKVLEADALATKDVDEDGWVTAYNFKTGTWHRLLAFVNGEAYAALSDHDGIAARAAHREGIATLAAARYELTTLHGLMATDHVGDTPEGSWRIDTNSVIARIDALLATPTAPYDDAARAGDAEQGASCHHHWHPTSSRPRNTHICCHCGTTRSMIGIPPEYYDRADDCGPCLPGHTP